jgi:hypothetical protein
MTLRKAAEQALLVLGRRPNSNDSILETMKVITVLQAALAQTDDKPIAWMDREGDVYKEKPSDNWCPPHMPLYNHPPQSKPLTEDEIELLAVKHAPPIDPAFAQHDDFIEFVRAIERKHGIGDEA